MVRLSYPLLVVVALAASAFAAPVTSAVAIAKRSTSQITSDLATITTKIAGLDEALKNFEGDKDAADAIYQDVTDVGSSVEQSAKDVAASGHFSEADSSSVVGAVENLSSKIDLMLKDLVAKKSAFGAAAPATVRERLHVLDSAVMAFLRSLKGPLSSQKGPKHQVKVIKKALRAAFRTAKEAYH